MALAPPAAAPERRASPGLQLNLSSNNPFRNRTASPALPSPASLGSPVQTQSGRPTSTNPFLTDFESANIQRPASNGPNTMSSPRKSAFGSDAKELFDNLTLDDKNHERGLGAPFAPAKRADTLPIGQQRLSDEGQRRRYADQGRRPSRPRAPPDLNDPFASPERRSDRRPRRTNSDSSIQKPLTEEEKRARDQRRRERERRHRERGDVDKDGKPRKSSSSKPRRPGGFDIIDKLDVTGLYGAGLFHHDGPFDAANPHRNRRKDHKAPMQAFPKDSANNTIGGSGPVNKRIDMDRIYGREREGYNDYNRATEALQGRKFSFETKERPVITDPYARIDPIHGEETSGLGTSTFLEGTPASRAAMQRRESENDTSVYGNGSGSGNAGGLQRKKSLAQRLRGMSQPRRPPPHLFDDAPQSPESPPQQQRKGSIPGGVAVRSVGPQSAGGRLGAGQDTNPFFNDYDEAYEKKGASIRVAEQEKERPGQRERAPSSPRGLQRSVTNDGIESGAALARVNTAGGVPAGGRGGGLLGRMKSMKRNKPKA